MKIVHVAWGFQPFRDGGLISYAEDLMEAQVKVGYDVHYFCTGRSSILLRKPTIRKWKNARGYQVYELWNPPIISGGTSGVADPVVDFHEPRTEKLFIDFVTRIRPDIVHFQEFVGVPTSLINLLKGIGIKTVFTIEDYFVLCPTLTMVKKDGSLCTLNGSGLAQQCQVCCFNAPINSTARRAKASVLWIQNWSLGKTMIKGLVSLKKSFKKQSNHTGFVSINSNTSSANGYLERRQQNLMNIANADLVIAMSKGVAAVFNRYGALPNMIVLNLTLKHLSDITPRVLTVGDQIRFGLINVMGSTNLKGKALMFELFELINNDPISTSIQFILLGNTEPGAASKLEKYNFVKCFGKYQAEQLGIILEELDIHVGIVPSVWEEAYGFVGVEFLAKGIPVIGNKIGGMPDYVIENESGWLNNSLSALEMFQIIKSLIQDRDQIRRLNNNLIENRDIYIKDMATHMKEMDVLYSQVLSTNPQVSFNHAI